MKPPSPLVRLLFCPTCDNCPGGIPYERFLDTYGVSYRVITEKEDPHAIDLVKQQNGRKIITPSFIFPDDSVLTRPSLQELKEKLKTEFGLADDASSDTYDLIVIGSGPAGMSAALTVARGGWQVLILEKRDGFGGQVDEYSRIYYYSGVRNGSSGRKFMDELESSRKSLSIDIKYQEEVDEIYPNHRMLDIKTTTGRSYRSSAVIIATGATYRSPKLPHQKMRGATNVYFNLTDLFIHFQGNQVLLYGEGSSVFRIAACPTYPPRPPRVQTRMILTSNPKMRISPSTEHTLEEAGVTYLKATTLIDYQGNRVVKGITIKQDTKRGGIKSIPIDGVFLFPTIVVDDKYQFLQGIKRDQAGFIDANNTLETSLPNVFVAGDVRSGSIKDIAGAVADGRNVGEMIKARLRTHR
jgi:thioredoxin reductase (NADPH)